MIIFKLESIHFALFLGRVGRRRNTMEKLLRCRDLGPDCEFEACAETTEDALQVAVDHARAVHGLKGISEKRPPAGAGSDPGLVLCPPGRL